MINDINTVAQARIEVRRELNLPPSDKQLEKDELQRLYEELSGEELSYPDIPTDIEYIRATDLTLMIADELGIPRAKGTDYLRKAELLSAIGRLQ